LRKAPSRYRLKRAARPLDHCRGAAQIAGVEDLLSQLIQYVEAHPSLAYATVVLAALLEAVPVVGSFVPGSSIIIAISAFVAAGELSLAGVIASAVAGAAIGDGTAFLLGHKYQRRILGVWPMNAYPTILFAVNIPAIGLWACAHVLPGALAGTLWKQYGKHVEHFAVPVLAALVVLAAITWFVRRRRLLSAE
jgi:membrane-associated protein